MLNLQILGELQAELLRAEEKFNAFHSAHEGLAVIEEEVSELRDEVYLSPSKRNYAAMRREAVQVAAMAIRLITDICEKVQQTECRNPAAPENKIRRAAYLMECGRLDDLKNEGLEQFTPQALENGKGIQNADV